MKEILYIADHVMINDGYLICKYCGFEMNNYFKEYDKAIKKWIKCLTNEEKIIKDLLE